MPQFDQRALSGAEDRLKVFEALGSARKWLAVIDGGSHSLFVSRPGEGNATLRATRLVQLCARTTLRAMAKPSPAPWPCNSAVKGGPNIRACIASSMPGPVSRTHSCA